MADPESTPKNKGNLAQPGDTWKVRLIEDEFMKRMWEAIA